MTAVTSNAAYIVSAPGPAAREICACSSARNICRRPNMSQVLRSDTPTEEMSSASRLRLRRSTSSKATRTDSTPLRAFSTTRMKEELDTEDPGLPAREDAPSVLGPLLVVSVHIGFGVIVMCMLEAWSPLDALYFCVVTASTVGYGDLVPTRPISKLFVSVFVLASVALIGSALSAVVDRFAITQQRIGLTLQTRLSTARAAQSDEAGVKDVENGHGLVAELERGVVEARSRLLAGAALVAVSCVAGAVTYGVFLQKLSIIDIVYFITASLTTAGFGDIHPVSQIGKLFAVSWLIFASIGFANLVGQYSDLKALENEVITARELMSSPMSETRYKEFDADADGVISEIEYIQYVLVKLGKVDAVELAAIRRRFRDIDVDGNGFITRDEIEIDY